MNYQKGLKLDTIDNHTDACIVMSTFYRQLKTYELVEEIKLILFLSTCCWQLVHISGAPKI